VASEAVLTVKQAAERMGVSAATVYLLCASRRLRHTRVGLRRGKIAITEHAVEEYLKGREVGPASPKPPPAPRPRIRFEHLKIPS
jgi:excisionase family DNA binding protein